MEGVVDIASKDHHLLTMVLAEARYRGMNINATEDPY